jgi:chromosomal replication initiation ATPase DnaA
MILEIKITANPGQSMSIFWGALQTFKSFVELFGFKFDISFNQQTVSFDTVENVVCQEVSHYLSEEVTPKCLRKRTRKRSVVYSRQILMKFIMNTNSSIEAGKRYGLDHATALHAVRKVEDMYSVDKTYKRLIDCIETRARIKIL